MWWSNGTFGWVCDRRRRCRRCLFACSTCRTRCHCSNTSPTAGQRSGRCLHCWYCPSFRHFLFYSNQRNWWLTPCAWAAVALVASGFSAVDRLLLLFLWWIIKLNVALMSYQERIVLVIVQFARWFLHLPDGNLIATPIFNWFIRSNAMRCRFFRSTSDNSCRWVFLRCKYFPLDDFQMQLPCSINKFKSNIVFSGNSIG